MLDPTQLLGGVVDLSDQLMLTSVIGAVLIGIGVGLVARNQATTGGSDIVALILQKYTHLPFSKGILLVDAMVVLFGLVVIGFGLGSAKDAGDPSLHLSFYSLIAIYITSRVVAFMVSGSKDDKLMFVISEKRLVDLQHYILNDLSRSGTYIKSSGMYSGEDKEMLFLVVSYKGGCHPQIQNQGIRPPRLRGDNRCLRCLRRRMEGTALGQRHHPGMRLCEKSHFHDSPALSGAAGFPCPQPAYPFQYSRSRLR